MRYEQEAIYVTPPLGSDQLDDAGNPEGRRAVTLAFTTSSTAATQLVCSSWLTITTDQDVQLRFWKTNGLTGPAFGPVLAADFPLWQKTYMQWVCDGFLWVRAKGMTAAGTLYFYPSA